MKQLKTINERKIAKAKALAIEANETSINLGNALLRAHCDLELNEKRLVLMAVARLNSMPGSTERMPKPLYATITALEYAELFQLDAKTAYAALKSSIKALLSKTITFETETSERETNWTAYAEYFHLKGYVEIGFNTELSKHLLNLKANFTQIELKEIARLRTKNGTRLFELLSQFKQLGVAKFKLDKFYKMMNVADGYKSNFNDVRKFVINPALKDIKQHLGLEVELETLRDGRKISTLIFKFKPSKQMTLNEVSNPVARISFEGGEDSPKKDEFTDKELATLKKLRGGFSD